MTEPSSQLPQFHVIGFTGHRQLAEPSLISAGIRLALTELKQAAPGEWLALSSIAAGSDTLFAREAMRQNLAWQAVLPLPPAEFMRISVLLRWIQANHIQKLCHLSGAIIVISGLVNDKRFFNDFLNGHPRV